MEYVDILKNIPESIQKERTGRDTPDSKPRKSAPFPSRPAIALEPGYQAKCVSKKEVIDQTRPLNLQAQDAGCQAQGHTAKRELEDSADGEGDESHIGSCHGADKVIVERSEKKCKSKVNETVRIYSESFTNR